MLFNVLKNNDQPKPRRSSSSNVVGHAARRGDARHWRTPDWHSTRSSRPTPGAAEGAVVATDPAAGDDRHQDQSINVFYNPIKTPVPIPDVKGKTLEEATSTLTGAGFTVSPDPMFVVDSSIQPGKVFSTDPPFGSRRCRERP